MIDLRIIPYAALLIVSASWPSVAQQVTNPPFATVVETISPLDPSSSNHSRVGSESAAAARIVPQAAAPQLTRELVFAVGSSQYYSNKGTFWEYTTQVGQSSTTADHGGQQLRVVVQEIGYGGTPTARMNGTILPQSANYQNTNICIVSSQYVSPCPAGYTVVGYYHYFNLDGYQSGTFRIKTHR